MRGAEGFVFASLLAVAFAGCASSDASTTGAASGGNARVSGLVTDDQLVPVSGAMVSIADAKNLTPVAQTATDDSGAFDLPNVPAGDWVLIVNATGHKPFTRLLKVFDRHDQAGLRFTLEPIPAAKPFHETTPGSIIIQLGVAWQIGGDFNQGCIVPAVTCNAYSHGDQNGANRFFYTHDRKDLPLQTVFLEEVWSSTSPLCAKAMAIDLYNPDAPSIRYPSFDNPHYWTNYPHPTWKTSNPIVMEIPRASPGNADAIDDPERIKKNGDDALWVRGNWTVRHFPPGKGITNLPVDVNCFTDQTFDMYWSAFYLDPAPPGFTGRPQ